MSKKDAFTKPDHREIIDDFAKEISSRKTEGSKPSKEVIYFRQEHVNGIERKVYLVPIELLRYRKDNGRIKSDILSYEKLHEPLQESSKDAQGIIKKYIKGKDPELTKILKSSILHSGQREAAIITCDGFLINGNRRKLALEELSPNNDKYTWMKVVILPGKDDPGGPPTLLEIEQIENRYQLQSEGKAEYYKFDRALSIRSKIKMGMKLEDQLRDDPSFINLPPKEFMKKVKEYQEEYLEPLKCIDRYLEHLGRSGLYDTVSKGISDKEGRWQAFLDYYKVYKKINSERHRISLGLEEDEIGDVEDIAFKIIRKRDFHNLPKVHSIMRELPKWLGDKHAKKELFKLLDVDIELPKKECFDDNGNEFDERKKDQLWSAKHQETLISKVKNAKRLYDNEKEKENPLTLLEAALKKLEHEKMIPETVKFPEIPRAMQLTREIKDVADKLESEFYHLNKKLKKLEDKFNQKNNKT